MAAKKSAKKSNLQKTAKKTARKTAGKKPAVKKAAASKPVTPKKTTPRAAARKAEATTSTNKKAPTAIAPATKTVTITRPRTGAVVTTIVANIDTGFGNELFIRGAGGDLSWDAGVQMECIGAAEWRFSTTEASDLLEVKFLLNDNTWSSGQNVTVAVGEELVVEPVF